MDDKGIKAIQTTHLRQVQMQEAKDRVRVLNLRGHAPKLKPGDRVSFFIPPSSRRDRIVNTEGQTHVTIQRTGNHHRSNDADHVQAEL